MDSIVRIVAEALAERIDVETAWVFGSVAQGRARATSDVDVAIRRGRPPTHTLADAPGDLVELLESRTGRTVDLVVVDTADPELVHRVLRDGILVVDRDRSARIAWEVRMRNEYFDLMPHRLAYRRAMAERAKRRTA